MSLKELALHFDIQHHWDNRQFGKIIDLIKKLGTKKDNPHSDRFEGTLE